MATPRPTKITQTTSLVWTLGDDAASVQVNVSLTKPYAAMVELKKIVERIQGTIADAQALAMVEWMKVEKLSTTEAALALGVSVKTIHERLRRAKTLGVEP